MDDNPKEQKALAKKKAKVVEDEDKTVKPDWMKAMEDSDDEETAEIEESPGGGSGKKKSRSQGKHKAMFTEKTMPKLSPTVLCVMMLAWLFFIVYTALALLRTVNQLSRNRFGSCLRAQQMVAMLCPYVMFAPMLSVLFLATRMRAIQLAQGDTERYQLPQPWVQSAMYLATYGVMLQVVFKLLTFSLNYRFDAQGTVVPVPSESRLARSVVAVLKYGLMACIYGGFTAVCVGATIMPAPKELWDGETPPLSASLRCTMMLTSTFFLIYLGLSLFRTAE